MFGLKLCFRTVTKDLFWNKRFLICVCDPKMVFIIFIIDMSILKKSKSQEMFLRYKSLKYRKDGCNPSNLSTWFEKYRLLSCGTSQLVGNESDIKPSDFGQGKVIYLPGAEKMVPNKNKWGKTTEKRANACFFKQKTKKSYWLFLK